jgi:hypothetical protein
MLTIPTLKNHDAKLHLPGASISAPKRAVLCMFLLGALVVTTPASVSGTQSVTLAWNPVTNANVAGYEVYYGPASGNYTNVTSVGNVTNATISGLTDGATYFFATTTFSTSGLESGYSSEVSYTVPNGVPGIQVTPGSIGYGTVLVGASKTNSFNIQNVGTGTLSGSASVGAPFNVVSGSSYSLAAGQTQAVVVVFSPVVASNYNQSVSFSGGGGTNVAVSASATNAPVPTPMLQVNPGSIGYGTVPAGTSATNSFTVRNIGTGMLSGSATVGAPFNVMSGGSYSLAAGQTQAVVVVFSPVVAGNYSQSVNFSGAGGTNVTVSGSVTNATNSLTPPSFTIVSEKVTASITNPITLQFCTNLSSPTWWPAGTFVGSTNLSFTNTPAVLFRGVCSNLTSSITLTWPASTNPNTMGYKVFYGTSSGVYTYVLNVGRATTVTIPNLTEGKTYYFFVCTYNSLGTASPYLTETSVTAPTPGFTLSIGH